MEDEATGKPVTAPDPADMTAYVAARKAGWRPDETPNTPAEETVAVTDGKRGAPKPEAAAAPAAEPPKPATPKPDAAIPSEEHGPGWFRREIKRIRQQTRAEIEAIRAEMAAKTAPAPAAAPAATVAAPHEPQESEFDTYAAYTKALAKFYAAQVAAEEVNNFRRSVETQLEAEQREASERVAASARQAQDIEWAKAVEHGRSVHDDFDEVVFNARVTPLMDHFAQVSENGDEVAYYLGSHPDEVARIASLPQMKQVEELIKIRQKFSGNGTAVPDTPTSQSQPKPKPPTPVSGGNGAGIKSIDDPDVLSNYPEWKRRRQAQLDRR